MGRRSVLGVGLVLVAGAGLVVACSATSGGRDFGVTPGSGGSSASGQGGGDFHLTGNGGSDPAKSGILKEAPPCEGVDPSKDNDGDGFTGAQGDCNDCTAQINPGAYDYPGNGVDEDCDGKPDDTPVECDGALALDGADGMDGARAIGLCKLADGPRWGVLSARWLTADGQPLVQVDPQGLGHGVLAGFGPKVKPQEGSKLLALSSGTARLPTDPGYQPVSGYDKGYTTGAPPGYPKESPSCPGVVSGTPHDSAALEVVIKTPTNAKSLSFDLDFYTYEFPHYTCSEFNDFMVAMLSPVPVGQQDGNISFDAKGNTISVNAGFLEVCGCDGGPPCQAGNKSFACSLGRDQLTGTGFDDSPLDPFNSAATGWLVTTAPLASPGDPVTLLFAIWDSGDGVLDSTVLIDNFTFEAGEAPTKTAPVPVPK
jgi:hypothetical protein